MLERFDDALATADPVSPEQAAGLARLTELRRRFGDWCDRLAASPGGASLDHNDLHGGNVFLDASGGARFFDWGDAVVSHPFASALVLRSVVRWLQDVHVETSVERRILDAYLEPFGALGSVAERRQVVDLACEVGKVARSLVWRRAVAPMPADTDDPDDFRGAPVRWLLELLEGPFAADPHDGHGEGLVPPD
jgi:aminoglycoside phosphotransferase (APT) family kinase protein